MEQTKRKVTPNQHILLLSFAFFAIGVVIFLAAMVIGIWFLPDLAALQSLRNQKGWLLAHLFLLGWATMVAMGASYQITQVILRSHLYSRLLGYIHLLLYSFGVIGLLCGFAAEVRWIVFGGVSIALGAVLYVFNLVMTFVRKKEWNLFVFGVSLSLLGFLFTIAMGIMMGLGSSYGWNSGYYNIFFYSHLWFGIGSWLSGLIIVYSFKLLPMFYASRKKPTKSDYWIVAGYQAGIWLHVVALWSDVGWIAATGTILIFISLGWFLVHMDQVRRQSIGTLPIGAVKIALYLLPVSGILFVAWTILNWVSADHSSGPLEALILFLVLGWFSASIWSYLSKILPFLWWAHLFQLIKDKKQMVRLSDMLPERRMTWELCGYLIGISAVVGGYLLQLPLLVAAGQVVAVVFIIIYLFDLLRVFRY